MTAPMRIIGAAARTAAPQPQRASDLIRRAAVAVALQLDQADDVVAARAQAERVEEMEARE